MCRRGDHNFDWPPNGLYEARLGRESSYRNPRRTPSPFITLSWPGFSIFRPKWTRQFFIDQERSRQSAKLAHLLQKCYWFICAWFGKVWAPGGGQKRPENVIFQIWAAFPGKMGGSAYPACRKRGSISFQVKRAHDPCKMQEAYVHVDKTN